MSSELAKRVVTAVIGAPVAIALVYAGGLPFALFLAILSAAGTWELYRLARQRDLEPLDAIGIISAAGIPVLTYLTMLGVVGEPLAVAGVVFLAILGATLWARGVEGRPLQSAAVTIFAILYTGGTLSFAYALRNHRFIITPIAGTALVAYPILLTWASDIGAYFFGRWFGRRKLMPAISPGKTVAGALGGLGLTLAVSIAYNNWVLRPTAELALTLWTAVIFGLVVSVAGQIGDLTESMLKREAGMKDSSRLIPGHGGVLDRLDSLFFVLPVAYLMLSRLIIPAPS